MGDLFKIPGTVLSEVTGLKEFDFGGRHRRPGGGPRVDPSPPKPAAVVRESSAEVFERKRQTRRNLRGMSGIGSTIIAGGNPGLRAGKELLSGGR